MNKEIREYLEAVFVYIQDLWDCTLDIDNYDSTLKINFKGTEESYTIQLSELLMKLNKKEDK